MFEFRVTELVRAQSAEGAVQLEQLQAMTPKPPANQEAREMRRQEKQWADVSHLIHSHPFYTKWVSRKQPSNSEDLRHSRGCSILYFGAKLLQVTLKLNIFDFVTCVLESSEHWPMVLGPEGMVHTPKGHLLLRSPEMRDQELAGEKVHQDKDQVIGKGRDGYHHQWNGLDHISAKLTEFLHVPVRQVLVLYSVSEHLYFYPLHFPGISEQQLESFHKSVVQLIESGKSLFKELFIFIICRLEPGRNVSTNTSSNFR